MAFCGLLFGLATACKWNAIVTLAAVGMVALILYWRNSMSLRDNGGATLVVALILALLATYVLAYWQLCRHLHRPFTIADLVSMNEYIWRYHVTCPGNPALDVRWYRWFLRSSPERGLSYLVGNFVVVWGGLFALVICGWRFLRGVVQTTLKDSSIRWSAFLAEGMVCLFYAVNLSQWVVIPQKRLVYYYYPSAMLLGAATAIALHRAQGPKVLGIRLSVVLLVASAVFFLYCYPRMASLESPYDCMFGCWT